MGLWALAKARVCVIMGQCCSQVNLIAVANMFTPSLLLGFVIALLTGLLFHLIVGGGFWRLILFCVMSLVGFGLGQLTGVVFEVNVLMVGQLHGLTALAGALIALVLSASVFGQQRSRRPSR